MTIEPDRNTYRAKDVAPAGANASEVLEAVPSVQVDGDGKVSLRGNENVVVQINGRPSPIRGTQLAAYLKSFRRTSSSASRSIPNPSAQYDPEGMAGIINIVLKQNVDLGLSGGAQPRRREADRYNASGNIGYQSGPLTTVHQPRLQHRRPGLIGINDRERYDAASALSSVDRAGHRRQQRPTGQNFSTQRRLQAQRARRVLQRAVDQPSRGDRRVAQRLHGARTARARCSTATAARATPTSKGMIRLHDAR